MNVPLIAASIAQQFLDGNKGDAYDNLMAYSKDTLLLIMVELRDVTTRQEWSRIKAYLYGVSK